VPFVLTAAISEAKDEKRPRCATRVDRPCQGVLLPIRASSAPSTETSGSGFGDPRPVLLVVDDEDRNRALMRAFLGGDYDVLEAEDGPRALAALARGGIDLVILDVMMPGTSGFDVCREIKRAAGDELLPVLLVTALSDHTDRQQGLLAGADDFLSKPVDRQELLLRVKHFLRLRRQHLLLLQQYEALQELVALKDDLVTLMVHDLRNPLTGVLGTLQLLEQDISDPIIQADAENARNAGEKMRETLDDLLQVRLLEEGRVALRREQVWLQEVVRSASESLEGMARMRNLHINHAIDGRLSLHADASLVRRAVENLLSNAIKFSPAGQTIEVGASSQNRLVAIEVADRGTGVAPERRPQLFEKFGGVRVQRPSDRRGYGLGLYLVKLVADAHGGSVAVRDREGGGTLLCLSLPEGPGAGP
jgi:two-component system, sensor histidine kinase and response regulator